MRSVPESVYGGPEVVARNGVAGEIRIPRAEGRKKAEIRKRVAPAFRTPNSAFRTQMTCPNCGAEVPDKSLACPECGSDEQTGWSEEAHTGGLDLPDEHFDYRDYVKREFAQESPVPRGIHWFWWLVALGLVAVFVMFWLHGI